MNSNNSWSDIVAFTLVVVGAVNWGLIGGLNFDAVQFLFGENSVMTRSVYGVVGLSGVYLLITKLSKFLKTQTS